MPEMSMGIKKGREGKVEEEEQGREKRKGKEEINGN